jgi:uncharacterized damage-inducible protein DinB
MDKAAIEDLYAFTGWAWQQIIDEAGASEEILARPAPGSGWPALRNCLGHIILGYERWLPAIIELKSMPVPDLAEDDFRTWAALEAHRQKVRDKLISFLRGCSGEELNEVCNVDVDGAPIPYSRAELITHLLLHERGHHGDVITLFYQLGMETPMLEYRFHLKREG